MATYRKSKKFNKEFSGTPYFILTTEEWKKIDIRYLKETQRRYKKMNNNWNDRALAEKLKDHDARFYVPGLTEDLAKIIKNKNIENSQPAMVEQYFKEKRRNNV